MINDLKYALRMLVKTPAFTIIAAITLALGIGANSAIFSVVDAILLRPLPFQDPDQLVTVWGRSPTEGGNRDALSFPDYADLRDDNKSFSALAAYRWTEGPLAGAGEMQLLRGVAVTAEIFRVLGVQPLLGRAYTADDHKEGAPYVIMLSHAFWQRGFGADQNVIGREITLSGRRLTVIGVMPPGWKFPVDQERIDYLAPLEYLPAAQLQNRGGHSVRVVGRLKPGVSIRQAEAETSAIASRLAREYPSTNANRLSTAVIKLHSDVVGDVRPALLILLGAVALVLLIACANVANLLLARAAARNREIAIRTALGASRGRIIRQLLCESLLLAMAGAGAGLLLAWWGVDLLNLMRPRGLPHLAEIRVNPGVAAFTFALGLVSTLLAGFIPALQVSRPSVNEALQHGAKGSTGGLQGARAFLIVSQVSLSLLLLASAGLLIKSFFNLRATSPGFDPERLMTTSISLPRVRYPEIEQQLRTHGQILQKLSALPGVESAGAVSPLPLSGVGNASSFIASGMVEGGPGSHPDAGHLVVAGDYFRAMTIPVLRGRVFGEADTEKSPPVLVINDALARKFFPGRDPVGQWIRIDGDGSRVPPRREIIGVVNDSRHEALAKPPRAEFYVPFSQQPVGGLDYVLRTSASRAAGLDAAVRHAVDQSDKDLFVPPLRAMETLVSNQLAQPAFNMMLLGVFAGLALTLAAIGIYGVIAYSVAQRTREIGIRMALGAQRTDMLGMILRQSLTLVVIGLIIGLVASFAGTRLLKSLLYGVGAADIATYALVVFVLGGAALLASYIPARRAMRVDPMVALRYE
ncbi:MAG TPA: ABC transporter permease [Chthoniobacterales bacterium]|nr:ABC transporter permease [Chthoniobacterales bacterium]